MKIGRKIGLAAMLIAVAASMIAAGRQPKIFNSVDTDAMNHWVDTTMARLSLDEKIAQLIIEMNRLTGTNQEGEDY